MKKIVFIISLFFISLTSLAQVPNANLIRTERSVSNTNMGLITSPVTGSVVYNTDSQNVFFYNGTRWTGFGDVDQTANTKATIQVTNTATGNLNASATSVPYTWINTTSGTGKNISGSFTVATDGITVTRAGTYLATVSQYQVAASFRIHAAINFSINGVKQTPIGANYLRSANTDSDISTVTLGQLFTLTAGQKVGLVNFALNGTSSSITSAANTLILILEEK